MRKFQQFFYDVLEISKSLNEVKYAVKNRIGDSINNNRTLSVNQVVRFLDQHNNKNAKVLAQQIINAYEVLKYDMKNRRSRTDAIDINEFIKSYRIVVMNGRCQRNAVGKAVSKVG